MRAYFAKRVVILGAESTGTTSLSIALKDHYKTDWVAEYGREYCIDRSRDYEWGTNDFIHIASEQCRREDEKARNANKLLICDTDAFATSVWHKRYMGFYSPIVENVFNRRKIDLYILTGDEIPFVQDGTRDGEHIRHEMHQWFIDRLDETKRKYIIVTGSPEERLKKAIEGIDKIMK